MSHGKHTTDLTQISEDAWAGPESTLRLGRPGVFALARAWRVTETAEYAYLWGWRGR